MMSSSAVSSDGTGRSGHGPVKGEELIVEKVLNRRLNKAGQLEYLIKWEGHGDQNNTWEREENPNCLDKIEEFEWSRAARKDMERAAVIIRARREAGEDAPDHSSACSPAGGTGMKLEIGVTPQRGNAEAAGADRTKVEETGKVEEGISETSASWKELHPLLNPVILTNLFDICPHEDLRNCQLVCRTWHANSLTAWRSTSTIALRFSETNELIYLIPRKKGNQAASTSLSQFLDLHEQECMAKPYRQFHLINWTFSNRGEPSSRSNDPVKGQQDRFLDVVGRNVTVLKLSKCRFAGDAREFRKFLFQTWPSLRALILDDFETIGPKRPLDTIPSLTEYVKPVCGQQIQLKSLSLYKTDLYTGQGDQDFETSHGSPFPMSYLELLSHFPSLATLNVSLDPDDSEDGLLSLLKAIQVIRREDVRKLPLKRFDIGPEGFHLTTRSWQDDRSQEILSLFQELNLSLNYLVVDYSTKLEEFQSLLLSETGKTIRKLKAVKYSGPRKLTPAGPKKNPFPCGFPFGLELSNLQTLILSCTFSSDMEFLKWTPNLVKLHMSTYGDGERSVNAHISNIIFNTDQAEMANVKLLNLKELFLAYLITEEGVMKLGQWMPKLEILSMFLIDEQFTIVCEQWRGLTHLHQLGGPDLHDKGITGMGWDDDDGSIIRPNITMLKNLYCFQYARQRCSLTDVSVYNGFLKLSNLRILDISSEKKLISDKAVEALQEKIPNCQVRAREGRRRARTNGAECKYFKKD